MIIKYKNGYYYIREKVKGKECFRSLGIKWKSRDENLPRSVQAAANEILRAFKIEQALKVGGSTAHHLEASLDTMEKVFWQRKDKNTSLTEGTRSMYRYCWKTWRRHFRSLEECQTLDQLENFVVRRSQETVAKSGKRISGKTIKEELRTFFGAWKACVEMGVIMPPKPGYPQNFDVKGAQDLSRKGKMRSAKRIAALVAALATQEARDRIILCALTGLRFEETNRIQMGTLKKANPKRGIKAFLCLPKEATKERRERLIGLTAQAYQIVRRNWPFKSRNNRKQIESASKRLGIIPYLHCRDMRHSFATACVAKGVSQTHVDLVMGHLDGTNKLYQSQTKAAATRVALAADRWLNRRHLQNPGRGEGGESGKIIPITRKLQVS